MSRNVFLIDEETNFRMNIALQNYAENTMLSQISETLMPYLRNYAGYKLQFNEQDTTYWTVAQLKSNLSSWFGRENQIKIIRSKKIIKIIHFDNNNFEVSTSLSNFLSFNQNVTFLAYCKAQLPYLASDDSKYVVKYLEEDITNINLQNFQERLKNDQREVIDIFISKKILPRQTVSVQFNVRFSVAPHIYKISGEISGTVPESQKVDTEDLSEHLESYLQSQSLDISEEPTRNVIYRWLVNFPRFASIDFRAHSIDQTAIRIESHEGRSSFELYPEGDNVQKIKGKHDVSYTLRVYIECSTPNPEEFNPKNLRKNISIRISSYLRDVSIKNKNLLRQNCSEIITEEFQKLGKEGVFLKNTSIDIDVQEGKHHFELYPEGKQKIQGQNDILYLIGAYIECSIPNSENFTSQNLRRTIAMKIESYLKDTNVKDKYTLKEQCYEIVERVFDKLENEGLHLKDATIDIEIEENDLRKKEKNSEETIVKDYIDMGKDVATKGGQIAVGSAIRAFEMSMESQLELYAILRKEEQKVIREWINRDIKEEKYKQTREIIEEEIEKIEYTFMKNLAKIPPSPVKDLLEKWQVNLPWVQLEKKDNSLLEDKKKKDYRPDDK